jgi:hypothetical protein
VIADQMLGAISTSIEAVLGASAALIALGALFRTAPDDAWLHPAICPYCAALLTGRRLRVLLKHLNLH